MKEKMEILNTVTFWPRRLALISGYWPFSTDKKNNLKFSWLSLAALFSYIQISVWFSCAVVIGTSRAKIFRIFRNNEMSKIEHLGYATVGITVTLSVAFIMRNNLKNHKEISSLWNKLLNVTQEISYWANLTPENGIKVVKNNNNPIHLPSVLQFEENWRIKEYKQWSSDLAKFSRHFHSF